MGTGRMRDTREPVQMTDECGEWQEMRLQIGRHDAGEPVFQARERDLDSESYRKQSTICFCSLKS